MSVDDYILLEKTKGRTSFSNTDISDVNPESKLAKLVQTANNNDYFLHSYNSDAPKVVLIGYSHKDNSLDQEEEIESILRSSVEKNDIILREGNNPAVINLPSYKKEDHIGNLKDLFERQDNMYIFNDDKKLIVNHLITKSKIKPIGKDKENSIKETLFLKSIENYFSAFKKRDDNFCYQESVGIVPIANTTAKLYKTPSSDATIFQLVGLSHIYAGFIEENLRKENLPFVSFITKYEA